MATPEPIEPGAMAPTYLEQGLVALGRAGRSGWFDGHVGASMIALGLFEAENQLTQETRYLVRRQRTLLLTQFADFYAAPSKPGARVDGEARILAALAPLMAQLRTSGHAVIFGALALRALRAAPEVATAAVIGGIVALLGNAAQDRPDRYFGWPDYDAAVLDDVAEVPEYGSSFDMIRAALEELDEVYDDSEANGRRHFFAGEKLHGVTHAQALCLLEDMGHRDLARAGYHGHRRQLALNRQKPPDKLRMSPRRPHHLTPMDPGYWDGPVKDAHAFKLAYSGYDVLRRLPRGERVRYFAGLARLWPV